MKNNKIIVSKSKYKNVIKKSMLCITTIGIEDRL